MQDQATQAFASEPVSASAARRWSRGVTERWGAAAAADLVGLVVSELVTNAVVHGRGPVQVDLDLDENRVRVAVTDTGPGMVVMRRHDVAALGGRGLQIIEALAISWGSTSGPDRGKTVWATVRLQSGG